MKKDIFFWEPKQKLHYRKWPYRYKYNIGYTKLKSEALNLPLLSYYKYYAPTQSVPWLIIAHAFQAARWNKPTNQSDKHVNSDLIMLYWMNRSLYYIHILVLTL